MEQHLFLNREQSIAIDRIAIEQFGIAGIVLMENAGRNCAEEILELLPADLPRSECRILIACGPGNNGGDGFVIARHLSNAGCSVKVILFAEPDRIRGDAKINLEILSKTKVPCERFENNKTDSEIYRQFGSFDAAPVHCFVDCWLGTGAVGVPRKPLDRVIPIANRLDGLRIAIDIPTGINDAVPSESCAFRADVTLTIVARKKVFQLPEAQEFVGRVKVVGIGIPPEVLILAQKVG